MQSCGLRRCPMNHVSAITTDSHCPEKSAVQRDEEEKKVDKGTSKGRSGPSITECSFIIQFFKGLLSSVHKIQLCMLQKKKVA